MYTIFLSYNFRIVPVAVIKAAVGEICSIRIPKINADKIMFAPTRKGVVDNVTKSSFALNVSKAVREGECRNKYA